MHPSIPTQMISRLMARYAEPHRHYHTWQHIADVIDAAERISSDRSLELMLGILFHDAIYSPLQHDNEMQSALLLVEEGRRAGIGEDVLRDASTLVIATAHLHAEKFLSERGRNTPRAEVLLDADLSILGADDDVFDTYETNVRKEYAAVADRDFANGRAAIVKKFLARQQIFRTTAGRELWEFKARRNLARSLAKCAVALGEPILLE